MDVFMESRHIAREKAMICIYQLLLYPRSHKEVMENIFLEDFDKIDEFAVTLVEPSMANKDRFAGYCNEVLDKLTFDRLGFVEQAILLVACSEFDLKLNAVTVVIDEAVTFAKKYCDDDTYKLINGVLDKI